MADVVEALYTNGDKKLITDEIKAEIDKYYGIYGAR
jgi:orotate phosphoribosyltransferase